MAAQMGMKEKPKLLLGTLSQCYLPTEERPSPGTRRPAMLEECRGQRESVTWEQGCGK